MEHAVYCYMLVVVLYGARGILFPVDLFYVEESRETDIKNLVVSPKSEVTDIHLNLVTIR